MRNRKGDDIELTSLDSVYVFSSGNPQRNLLEGTANAIKVDETKIGLVECKVSVTKMWFDSLLGVLTKTAFAPSKYHPAITLCESSFACRLINHSALT